MPMGQEIACHKVGISEFFHEKGSVGSGFLVAGSLRPIGIN